jgi:hypothetical protein
MEESHGDKGGRLCWLGMGHVMVLGMVQHPRRRMASEGYGGRHILSPGLEAFKIACRRYI